MGLFDKITPAYKTAKAIKAVLLELKINFDKDSVLRADEKLEILTYIKLIRSREIHNNSISDKAAYDIEYSIVDTMNTYKGAFASQFNQMTKNEQLEFILDKLWSSTLIDFTEWILRSSIVQSWIDLRDAYDIASTDKNIRIMNEVYFD